MESLLRLNSVCDVDEFTHSKLNDVQLLFDDNVSILHGLVAVFDSKVNALGKRELRRLDRMKKDTNPLIILLFGNLFHLI